MLSTRNAIVASFLIATISTASATPLPIEWKKEFAKGFVPRCIEQQRNAPMYKPAMESGIEEYCRCTANRAADNITLEEAKNRRSYTVYEALRPTIEEAGNYCWNVILNKIKINTPSSKTITSQ